MTAVLTFELGSARLSRVPYFDVDLPSEAVELSPAAVAANQWAAPAWTDGVAQVRIGQVFWVIESEGLTIVVDPCCASDGFLRTGPEAVTHQEAAFAAFGAAGFDPATVDVVIMSHLDGIGMNALTDGNEHWRRAFPNAPIVVSEPEWERIESLGDAPDAQAMHQLADQGAVRRVPLPHDVTSEVRLVASGGHSAGHATTVVASGDRRALLLGHLAVNPLHAAVPEEARLHDDAPLGVAALHAALVDAQTDDALVIGPLWPTPGAAHVTSLDPDILTPAAAG